MKRSAHPPSFISHPKGILLCVLKKSYTPALLEIKNISGNFICHPNRILLKILNEQQIRLQLSPGAAVISKQEILHALKRQSTLSSSSLSMVTMETKAKTEETEQNGDKQRVK